MSRPVKKGLDYFPMDTGFVRDLKIQRLLLEFGSEGLSIYLILLSEVYATNGYYLPVDPLLYPNIGFTLKIKEKKVKAIIDFCLMLDLFDSDLFDKVRILTSYGIQTRYAEIGKRTRNVILPAYRIERISIAETPVNVTETPVNVAETSRVLNENENENENKTDGKFDYGKNKFKSSAGTDSARREELLRMAALATGSGSNA